MSETLSDWFVPCCIGIIILVLAAFYYWLSGGKHESDDNEEVYSTLASGLDLITGKEHRSISKKEERILLYGEDEDD